jgi:hypothetical protein
MTDRDALSDGNLLNRLDMVEARLRWLEDRSAGFPGTAANELAFFNGSAQLGLAGVITGGSALGAGVARAATQSIANTTLTSASFDTERWDTDEMFDSGSGNKITVQRTGTYASFAYVAWDTNATNNRQVQLRYNGASVCGGVAWDATGSNYQSVAGVPWALAPGDYLEVVLYQNSGGARTATVEAALVRIP